MSDFKQIIEILLFSLRHYITYNSKNISDRINIENMKVKLKRQYALIALLFEKKSQEIFAGALIRLSKCCHAVTESHALTLRTAVPDYSPARTPR